jgi:hypothetical protein
LPPLQFATAATVVDHTSGHHCFSSTSRPRHHAPPLPHAANAAVRRRIPLPSHAAAVCAVCRPRSLPPPQFFAGTATATVFVTAVTISVTVAIVTAAAATTVAFLWSRR